MDEESGVGQEWADYAAIQEQIRKRPIIDHKTWAFEDKAEAILKAVPNARFQLKSNSGTSG